MAGQIVLTIEDRLKLIRNWSAEFKTMETTAGHWYGVVTHLVPARSGKFYDYSTADYHSRDNAIRASYDYVQKLVWGLTG